VADMRLGFRTIGEDDLEAGRRCLVICASANPLGWWSGKSALVMSSMLTGTEAVSSDPVRRILLPAAEVSLAPARRGPVG
jgi:hypothetical protein